jgi:hypothetical protein
MIDDDVAVGPPPTTGDELRAEFRTAQLRALSRRRVALWRDTNLPDVGPRPAASETTSGASGLNHSESEGTLERDLPAAATERPVLFQQRDTHREGT